MIARPGHLLRAYWLEVLMVLPLTLYIGLLDRPGEPPAEISLKLGYLVAVIGALLLVVGGATRASGAERPRKPPGVL